ncbi:hypothetical protein PRO82_001070 [Candidatus Protochlamydia amoebophila]|nr:hypothetical protein [Candidatus Protochlamydia amoebophila]
MYFHESIQNNRRKHKCLLMKNLKTLWTQANSLKILAVLFSKRALYWHIWRAGINGLAPAIYRVEEK